ncbi:uncharacterized protein C10orf95-like isoform X1 [Peromyscus leucopus]|uniref:uncharacterized protein C10orf95-like isoform X1 n=1 Tax=Peromyscus leucopus TaxID=10041 RepID=UPI0018849E73|nr:uncharacterized protein C10orf95-like isoform X1 [Peromyscus leucopus]
MSHPHPGPRYYSFRGDGGRDRTRTYRQTAIGSPPTPGRRSACRRVGLVRPARLPGPTAPQPQSRRCRCRRRRRRRVFLAPASPRRCGDPAGGGGRGARSSRNPTPSPAAAQPGLLGEETAASEPPSPAGGGAGPPAPRRSGRNGLGVGGDSRAHCRCHSPLHPRTTLTSARSAARALWLGRLEWQRGPLLLSQEAHMLMDQFPADSDAPWDMVL